MEVEMQTGDVLSSSALSVEIPPTMSLDALQSILASCGASITADQLQHPTANVVLQIYAALLTIPTLRATIAQFDASKVEGERRSVEMEMQLHDAERLKDEAEKRAEEDRIAKEAAIQEKNEISSQLAQVQGTLDALQSNSESGSQQSAVVKGQLEKIQHEKRDILEMLEREKVESARRAEEIDHLTVRSREARTEASRLTTDLQEAKSAEGTAMVSLIIPR
jgi:nucleoprotein TPR